MNVQPAQTNLPSSQQHLQHQGIEIARNAANTCTVCNRTAYPLEKVTVDEKVYHRACMRCAHCNKVLSPGNYSANLGKLYCKPHLLQLFKTSGNYNSGFGSEPHKNKWIKSSGVGQAAGGSENFDAKQERSAVSCNSLRNSNILHSVPDKQCQESRAREAKNSDYHATSNLSPSLNAAPSLRERLKKYNQEILASNEGKKPTETVGKTGRSLESISSSGQSKEHGSISALVFARRASFENAIEQSSDLTYEQEQSSSKYDTKTDARSQEMMNLDLKSAVNPEQASARIEQAKEKQTAACESAVATTSGKKKHVEIVEKRDFDDLYTHTYDDRTVEVYHKSLNLSPPLVRSNSALKSVHDETRYGTFVRRSNSHDMEHTALELSEKGLIEEDELTYLRELVRKYKHEIALLREQLVQQNQMVEEQGRIITELRSAQSKTDNVK